MEVINYTLRIDKADKQKAEEVFKTLGMTFSTGINIYLKTVGRERKIPFALEINDEEVQARKAFGETIRSIQEQSVMNGTDKMTMDEIDDIIAEVRQEKR
jgi:DNA-damage-inducible protein J